MYHLAAMLDAASLLHVLRMGVTLGMGAQGLGATLLDECNISVVLLHTLQ